MNNEMSVVLGTVAMVPKGEYNSEAYYEKLNTVLYNDSTYIAIKPSTGVLPTDTEYWQLIGGGVTKEYVQGQVVDNLDSNETTKSLSAKQGNNLNKSKVEVFDTVALMKAANLKVGMTAQTLGYYETNDGGGATYKITNVESETEYQEELNNGLYATLVIENNIYNINKLGIIGDNSTDIGSKLNNIFNTLPSRTRFYIPNGIYLTSITIDCNNDYDLIFESSNAIIKATDEMNTLFVYNRERKTTHYNRGKIENGTFDANDLANVGLEMNNAAAFELNHITINNCKQIGFKGTGSTTIAPANGGFRVYDMVVRNWNNAYTGSVGFYCNCSDSCFDNCVSINFETAFLNTLSNTFIKCHPWLSMVDLYENSVAFDHRGRYSLYTDCIIDSFRTAFKNSANTTINANNIECYDGTAFFNQEIQEQYPFIFHNGTASNALINAVNCRAYATYGNNQVATTYHSDSKFYNCSFRTSQNGSFDFSNYIDSSNVSDELSNKSFLTNIDFNNYYKKTKTYFVNSLSSATNNPSPYVGFLEVKCATPSNSSSTAIRVLQTYTEYTSGTKYERRYNGTAWTQWLQL